jgi:hypothetical protein
MKTIQLTALMAGLCFLNFNAKAQPSFLTNGLVAYYPFDGNANDASGNGNDGVVFGATLTTDRFGNASNAYSFTGATNYIACSGDIGISNNAPRTVSVWFEGGLQINGDTGGFVGWPSENLSGNPYGWANHIYFPEVVDDEFRIDTGDANSLLFCQPNSSNIFNGWHHFVWTYQTNFGNAVFYIDGIVMPHKRYQNSPTDTMNTGSGSLWIGAPVPQYNGSGYGFTGSLDDIRIYNRALKGLVLEK